MSVTKSTAEDSSNERSLRYFEAIKEGDKEKQAVKEEKMDLSSDMISTSSTSTTISAANFTAERSSKESSLRYFETSLPPSEISSNSLMQECMFWKRAHSLILLHIYADYKTELSCPGVKKQKVWKEIASEVRQKCLLNCDEYQCCKQIERLRHQYGKLKNINTTGKRINVFLAVAKNAFETTKNPVFSPAEASSSLLEKKCEQNVREHRKWYSNPVVGWGEEKRREKLVIKEEENPQSEVGAPPISAFNVTSTVPSSSTANSTAAASTSQSDSSKDENKFGDFQTIISPANVSTKKCRWTKIKEYQLLRVYAKYKAAFSYPDVEKQTVWSKIVKEVRKKTSLNCDELECRNRVDHLKCEYESIKNCTTLSRRKTNFLERTRKIFETTENPGQMLRKTPKWTKTREHKLLQVYDKYKAEFSYPDVKEKIVWGKIVEEFTRSISAKFDELECRNKIDDLKWQYERMKDSASGSRKMAKYVDKTGGVFKTTENPVTFPVEQPHYIHLQECGKRNKRYRYALLQVCAKYKREFDSPDIKEQKVWEKIVREMQEVFLYNCGETLCRFDLLAMKDQYDQIKNGSKTGSMPYYFDEAWKAFETDAEPERIFTVRVDELSKRVTELDLQDLFKCFGRIAYIYMTRDASGLCGGTAYISFCQQEDAHQAIFTVNGYKYDNLVLKVTWLENDAIRTLKNELYQSSCHNQDNYDDGDALSVNNASDQPTAFYGGEEKLCSKPCFSTENFQSFPFQKSEGLRYFQRPPS